MTPEQELRIIELEMQIDAVERALENLETMKEHIIAGVIILRAAIAQITGGIA
jgi:hypothetical protein